MLDTARAPSHQVAPEMPVRLDRFHVDDPSAGNTLGASLRGLLLGAGQAGLIVLCIGTDRSTGDSLGPLIGTRLAGYRLKHCHIYGTLDEPVHAANLLPALEGIRGNHSGARLLAIDACLGRSDSVGFINLCRGPLQPGTGVNKVLPSVGDWHITGVVNVGGFMEYMVLQNTRLNLVMRMAETISSGILSAVSTGLDCLA